MGAVDWSRTEHLFVVGAYGPNNPLVLYSGRRPLNPEDLTAVLRTEAEQERKQAEVSNAQFVCFCTRWLGMYVCVRTFNWLVTVHTPLSLTHVRTYACMHACMHARTHALRWRIP